MDDRDQRAGPAVIRLDDLRATPKYQQIVEQIRTFVADGTLTPGMALPSVRQLATDLGINVNTVVAAYRALEAEGIILLRRGSRATVHPRLRLPAAPQPTDVARVRSMLERVRVDALLLGLDLQTLRSLAAETFRES